MTYIYSNECCRRSQTITSGDHDEGEIDIEEAQRQQKMLETHWKVMAMTFRSQGDAYIFYNNHAREHGFSIRKQKVKRGASGMIRYRRFLCSRAGRRQSKFITMEGRKRRLRPETRCDCGAHMVVKLDRERGVWFVASFVDDHNHAMARPDEVCFYGHTDGLEMGRGPRYWRWKRPG